MREPELYSRRIRVTVRMKERKIIEREGREGSSDAHR
jgi:hypothetical protein